MSRTPKDDRLKPVAEKEDDAPKVYGVIHKDGKASVNRRTFLQNIGGVALAGSVMGCVSYRRNSSGRRANEASTSFEYHRHHSVESLCFSPDGRLLVSGNSDKTIKFWSFPDGKLLKILKGHKDEIHSVNISPDGKLLVSGSTDSTIRFWSLPEGTWLKELLPELEGFEDLEGKLRRILKRRFCPVRSVSISPDGKMMASGTFDARVRLWSLPEGKFLKTMKGHYGAITVVKFSPDGKYLASGNSGKYLDRHQDKTVKIWSLPDGELVKTLRGHNGKVNSIDISQDGKFLVFGCEDATVRIWSLPEGNLLKVLKGHDQKKRYLSSSPIGEVESVSISPDGRFLASGSRDKTIRLWSLPEGKLLKTLKGHTNWVNTVKFSPDGKFLASGSIDMTIKLWTLPEGRLRSSLIDENILAESKIRRYRQKELKHYTLPCGSPIPPSATCTCNCVGADINYTGTEKICTCDTISVPAGISVPVGAECVCNMVKVGFPKVPDGHDRVLRGQTCACNTVCTCNSVCSCDGHVSGGHYWHPN